MYQNLFRGLSLLVIVFGLIIVTLSTSVIADSGAAEAMVYCINGLNTTIFISVVLFGLSHLLRDSNNEDTILDIGIVNLLRYTLFVCVGLSAASFILRLTLMGAGLSLYMWIVAGVVFALILYGLSLLVVRQHKHKHISITSDLSA